MANEDRPYVLWLGQKLCCACGLRQSGPPHHPRHDVGAGKRAHDHRAVPLCQECHESIHRLTFGYFKGWVREQVREWCDTMGAKFRALYQRLEEP